MTNIAETGVAVVSDRPADVESRSYERRVLRRARRVLGAQLGGREIDRDVLAAAELIVEVGRHD
jgi:hypothetical protein